jgi:hypothetical protein
MAADFFKGIAREEIEKDSIALLLKGAILSAESIGGDPVSRHGGAEISDGRAAHADSSGQRFAGRRFFGATVEWRSAKFRSSLQR